MIFKSNNFLTTLTQQQILYDSRAYTRPPICLASQKAVAANPIWHSVLKNESLVLPAVEKSCGLVTTHPRFIRRLLSHSLSSPPVAYFLSLLLCSIFLYTVLRHLLPFYLIVVFVCGTLSLYFFTIRCSLCWLGIWICIGILTRIICCM